MAAGAEVHAKDQNGATLLHHAVFIRGIGCSGRPEVIRLLLNAGLDPNAMDKYGRTPLLMAEKWCRGTRNMEPEVIYKILLDASTDRH